jgi:hypothetical protein
VFDHNRTGVDIAVRVEDPQDSSKRVIEVARVLALLHNPLTPSDVHVALQWYSGYDELQRLSLADVEEEWRRPACRWIEPFHPSCVQIYPTTIMDVVSIGSTCGLAHVFQVLPDQELDEHRVFVRDTAFERAQGSYSW